MKRNKTKKIKEQDQLKSFFNFSSGIYLIEKPEFLQIAREVTSEFIEKRKEDVKELNEIYPVYVTEDLLQDKRLEEFAMYIANTAWNILFSQGYKMENLNTFFTEMWCQEHYKHSGMDQHVHNFGAQIIGFYFIDCPENGSKVVFHDPKPGKVQINLPQQNESEITMASTMVNFEAKPGTFIFTNAWLPHSFTRNESDKPVRFIHFNLTVGPAPAVQIETAPAEVV